MSNLDFSKREVEIRGFRQADWPSVREIYLDGIAAGEATFESQVPDWKAWDRKHIAFARLVAVVDGTVNGWAALSPVSARPVYSGVAEVSIYVARNLQGKGVGKALLLALILESEANGIWTLQSSVFPENEATVVLHKSCGFRIVGIRERIGRTVQGAWRDTVLLERRSTRAGA